MSKPLEVNEERLWQSLMDMAKIGATVKGGCNRQALTIEDQTGRDLFAKWCIGEECTVRVDEMGNMFARRPGLDDTLPPVITGSHLDTQPTGGKFDGVYGVLAGLEAIRVLNENSVTTKHPIEVVVWTNEEGARFSPAMIGSGVWAGEFSLNYAYERTDKSGITLQQALQNINYLGEHKAEHFPVKAAFELHIEQGPILEKENLPIGVVTGVQGIRWFDLTIKGTPSHAGPTPMESRNDPFMALNKLLTVMYNKVNDNSPWARVTFGDVSVSPGSRNTVPEILKLAIDLRHPRQSILHEMTTELNELVDVLEDDFGVEIVLEEIWTSEAVLFDEDCINAVTESVKNLNYPHMNIVSGAGHDSVYVSKVAPTSMIFIPCKDGLSHNEAEDATVEHIVKGANVLTNTLLIAAEPARR